MITPPSDTQRYELEGHLRLSAAALLADALTMGMWEPDAPALQAIGELVELAARFYSLAGWCSGARAA